MEYGAMAFVHTTNGGTISTRSGTLRLGYRVTFTWYTDTVVVA